LTEAQREVLLSRFLPTLLQENRSHVNTLKELHVTSRRLK